MSCCVISLCAVRLNLPTANSSSLRTKEEQGSKCTDHNRKQIISFSTMEPKNIRSKMLNRLGNDWNAKVFCTRELMSWICYSCPGKRPLAVNSNLSSVSIITKGCWSDGNFGGSFLLGTINLQRKPDSGESARRLHGSYLWRGWGSLTNNLVGPQSKVQWRRAVQWRCSRLLRFSRAVSFINTQQGKISQSGLRVLVTFIWRTNHQFAGLEPLSEALQSPGYTHIGWCMSACIPASWWQDFLWLLINNGVSLPVDFSLSLCKRTTETSWSIECGDKSPPSQMTTCVWRSQIAVQNIRTTFRIYCGTHTIAVTPAEPSKTFLIWLQCGQKAVVKHSFLGPQHIFSDCTAYLFSFVSLKFSSTLCKCLSPVSLCSWDQAEVELTKNNKLNVCIANGSQKQRRQVEAALPWSRDSVWWFGRKPRLRVALTRVLFSWEVVDYNHSNDHRLLCKVIKSCPLFAYPSRKNGCTHNAHSWKILTFIGLSWSIPFMFFWSLSKPLSSTNSDMSCSDDAGFGVFTCSKMQSEMGPISRPLSAQQRHKEEQVYPRVYSSTTTINCATEPWNLRIVSFGFDDPVRFCYRSCHDSVVIILSFAEKIHL